jgi:hypothetical protein
MLVAISDQSLRVAGGRQLRLEPPWIKQEHVERCALHHQIGATQRRDSICSVLAIPTSEA